MKLFEPVTVGNITLGNRIVMAPMTRCRATGNVPNELHVQYYGQRADAGLLITEGTSPSPNGLGYARIPGLYNQQQVAGWRKVTRAVHDRKGRIFLQIMHTGRVSHPANMPEGARMLAPSAIKISGQMWTDRQGMQDHPVAQAMTEADIRSTIAEYASCAELAIEAGFDGVELHGANGYLIEQFLNPLANQRSDGYGGAAAGRMRFALEVTKAVVDRIGGERTGIRVSPYGVFNDTGAFDGIDEFYAELSHTLAALKLAYIHVVDHSAMGAPAVSPQVKQLIRTNFTGAYILSGGYDGERAEHDLQAGRGDLVAFGRPFISNPDLVNKLRNHAALTPPNADTFYTPGPAGYTDY
ncbi:MAG: alkene reductase [Gammaproteobacteria bacterium]|nr:alkene reductase [Gammaproteobacteria bacterium]